MRGQCNQSPSQISLCLWTYPSPCSWQDTSNLTCVESDSNCHFSGQESATIPEMLLKFSELLHHMDGARQEDLIGRDFYAKMDFLNWHGLSRCTYHAYRIRKAFYSYGQTTLPDRWVLETHELYLPCPISSVCTRMIKPHRKWRFLKCSITLVSYELLVTLMFSWIYTLISFSNKLTPWMHIKSILKSVTISLRLKLLYIWINWYLWQKHIC